VGGEYTVKKSKFNQFILLLALVIILSTVLIPFLFLILNSIKPPLEFLSIPPKIFPSHICFKYYEEFFKTGGDTVHYLFNSVIITGATILISLFTGALAGYSLLHFKSSKLTAFIILLILMVRFYPKITIVIPYFILMKNMHLLDTKISIIIAHVSITLPFVVLLTVVFYRDVPKEIEESAMIDGCGLWQFFYKIFLSVIKPALATGAILTALISWNEFLIASSLASINAKTLPIAVASFITDKGIYWGPMSAMSVIIILPMVILTLIVQKHLVRGLTLGAVKG